MRFAGPISTRTQWSDPMYVPNHFSALDESLVRMIIEEFDFATIMSHSKERLFISHIPLILEGALPGGILRGHFAKDNEHAQMEQTGVRTTAVFLSSNSYVSPSWYESPGVPTWNYCAVHCHGKLVYEDSADELRDNLNAMLRKYENGKGAWNLSQLTDEHRERMMKAIRAFRIEIETVEAKFKLSQNRSPADRWHVIDKLSDKPPSGETTVAALMRLVLN